MVDQNKKYKIALIGDSLSHGGAEKIHGSLSIYFENQGFEVHNCIFIDSVSYQFSGSLLNLGQISPNCNSFTRKFTRFIALLKFVKSNKFDALIDLRIRPSFFLEFLLTQFIYPKNSIFYVLSGMLNLYFPKSILLSKILYSNRKLATVSEGLKIQMLKNNYSIHVKNVFQPFDFELIKKFKSDFEVSEKFILVVGNMNNDVKQIDKLILAYAASELPSKQIKLYILGDGLLKNQYIKLTEDIKIEGLVCFKGIFENPFPFYKKALFLVLSSKNEGLSNAIIESLACETPVVAFDCFSGPREIITNHENGILVENQNFDKLTEAMNLMATDKQLYQYCKQNAAKSVEKFSIGLIGKQWMEYLAQKI